MICGLGSFDSAFIFARVDRFIAGTESGGGRKKKGRAVRPGQGLRAGNP
jgi:hypothetical protein